MKLEEAKKLADKYDVINVKKKEHGRNITAMTKLRRKKHFKFKGKERVLPDSKKTTFYMKRYIKDTPFPREVLGVVEYAAYKILQYYRTIGTGIKIPSNITISYEEDDGQFTLTSNTNFKADRRAKPAFKNMLYKSIANRNIFFFALIGYADTHSGNIVVSKDKSDYYLIDFDFAFHPKGADILNLWTPQINSKQVRSAMLKSYIMYKQINFQKVRSLVDSAFNKANKTLDNSPIKHESPELFTSIRNELLKTRLKIIQTLIKNKADIETYVKYYSFEDDLKTYKPEENDMFTKFSEEDLENAKTTGSDETPILLPSHKSLFRKNKPISYSN